VTRGPLAVPVQEDEMRKWLFPLIAFGLAVFVVPGLIPTAAAPALEPTPTPPVATWTPGPPSLKTPVPPVALPPSAPATWFIRLCAWFDPTWPWTSIYWQDLWTVVQWQDASGNWHDVEGWRGTFDDVAIENGVVIAQKVWWVAQADLGKGPFHWLVYRGQGGVLLVRSTPFHLPEPTSGPTIVEVSLAP
jgi:hypothetical protein